MGYEVDRCGSDFEAIEKSKKWETGMPYPVHFSPSDTSGEKAFEEFYVEGEKVDPERFRSLGVITAFLLPVASATIFSNRVTYSPTELTNVVSIQSSRYFFSLPVKSGTIYLYCQCQRRQTLRSGPVAVGCGSIHLVLKS